MYDKIHYNIKNKKKLKIEKKEFHHLYFKIKIKNQRHSSQIWQNGHQKVSLILKKTIRNMDL